MLKVRFGMVTSEDIEQALRNLQESNERIEAKLDRLLGSQKPARARKRGLVTLPEGADRGTRAARLAAAKAFGLRATKRA